METTNDKVFTFGEVKIHKKALLHLLRWTYESDEQYEIAIKKFNMKYTSHDNHKTCNVCKSRSRYAFSVPMKTHSKSETGSVIKFILKKSLCPLLGTCAPTVPDMIELYTLVRALVNEFVCEHIVDCLRMLSDFGTDIISKDIFQSIFLASFNIDLQEVFVFLFSAGLQHPWPDTISKRLSLYTGKTKVEINPLLPFAHRVEKRCENCNECHCYWESTICGTCHAKTAVDVAYNVFLKRVTLFEWLSIQKNRKKKSEINRSSDI